MHWLTPLCALSLAALAARACPGDDHAHGHGHVHERRAYPQVQLAPPSRPLEWGDVNIIHTTDSHGWLLGHQKSSFPEPNYSGDLGDFASFVAHMKQLALEKDVDLLLVDSGDLHDADGQRGARSAGTGLSDGFPAGAVDGHESNKFLFELPYDVMAIGNHELYVYNVTYDMHKTFAPKLNGRYLSSNVNITVLDVFGRNVSVPVGDRYVKFKTRKGRKVTSLGVLFDFTGNDANTIVQKVEDMVKEHWFAEAIRDEPDFFLLAGHMPVKKSDNWPTVFNAIRAFHPTTPILILGGHTHIRDCVQYDGRSMALESGRYMETVGWMSANLDKKGSTKNLTFSRRYLDPNRVTYEYHSRQRNATFDTLQGKSITKGLNDLAKQFTLNMLYGTAPHDFTLTRAPYPSNDSLLSLFAEALTYSLTVNNTRADVPHIMIATAGSQRFDIYAGPFTKNDQLTASPFANFFSYIPNIPLAVARQVLPKMNGAATLGRRREQDEERYARGDVDVQYRAWLAEMGRRASAERRDTENATLGYVTSDSCPGIGDDIPHTPLPFFPTPDYTGSDAPTGLSDDTPIDLVFDNFTQDDLLIALNALQSEKVYTGADALPYTNVLAKDVLGIYAQKYWN
ncbi:hypothetical protein K466DRAFT_601739 [Polyporus arcularius HHB13444]|uniref:Calcineurin-like phosphoesterase domain-containing protein n=1 Tax=Polyporus arcularius HHB13444 TaxID=1314778 RepID=A0A5C3PFS0_9APHY|nr:hypothetical protein K466DRAFT_601739 [Polyporus arcularius HHB13444]